MRAHKIASASAGPSTRAVAPGRRPSTSPPGTGTGPRRIAPARAYRTVLRTWEAPPGAPRSGSA